MDDKGEKRGGIQKNRRRKDSVEHLVQRRTRWVGHVVRHGHHVGSTTEGKIEGRAYRGRPRDKYFGHDKKNTKKKSHREVKEQASDRKEWLRYTYPRNLIL
jgi:hypothetical protein